MRESLDVKERDALYGVYRATVSDIDDPEATARVRVKLMALDLEERWARLATWQKPSPGDEVLVAFEGGDPRQPYVVGALWSADGSPPTSMTLTTSGTLSVSAAAAKVAAASVEVEAGAARFSGVLQADTVIANSVVASSYTPGAGNVW